MAAIPNINSLITEPKKCPDIYAKERWNSKYTRGGNKWCDSQEAHCDPSSDYYPSDGQKLEDEHQNCGCRPGGLGRSVCLGGWGREGGRLANHRQKG